ncbi:MAG: hypothetical protein KKE00_00820 [Proteobacteria bacterium]|nr:hypothetical protein [Pseudomonadota bacterium]MBU1569061.1 hypothetical protein [Pseudomonadota bacterium]
MGLRFSVSMVSPQHPPLDKLGPIFGSLAPSSQTCFQVVGAALPVNPTLSLYLCALRLPVALALIARPEASSKLGT